MGRKKKFIDKNESSTFHVVHRSQQDKAAEGEEAPSEFVLIPSGPSREEREAAKGASEAGRGGKKSGSRGNKKGRKADVELGGGGDHINALGLPNDGYNYEQHFKSMGGGTFVSRAGRVDHFAREGNVGVRSSPAGLSGASKATIPEEALPSAELLDRQLEAVTISEKVMDADMRRALAAGVGEDVQEFSEENADTWLDDDFVVQAAGVDDEGGFDFDAHVTRLMEASARETGRLRRRTADDNLQTKGLARLRRVEDGDSSSSESDPDLDMRDNDRDGSDDSGEFDESLLEGLDLDGVRGGVRGRTGTGVAAPGEQGGKDEEERAVLDAQFEATLAAYDSDEWGELEEDDDGVQGQWDLEQHGYANACLDEFLQNKEDAAWVDGVERLPPEQRAIAVATLDKNSSSNNSNTNEDGCSPGGGPSAEGAAAAAAGSAAAPSSTISAGAKGGEQSGGGGGGGVVAAAEGTGPRLGKLQGLGGGGGGGGVVRRGAEEQGDDEGDDDDEEEDEFVDLGRHNEYLREKQVEKWDCETIVSTYSNLDNHPSVLGIGHKARSKNRGRGAQARAEEAAATAAAGREAGEVGVVQLSEKTGLPIGVLPERTHSDKGMISLTAGKNSGEKRDANETAEEKRLRKARIKQEKKVKREQKKNVKMAFTSEARVVAHALANPEAPQNRSVFNYS